MIRDDHEQLWVTLLLRTSYYPVSPVTKTVDREGRSLSQTVHFDRDRVSRAGRGSTELFRFCFETGLFQGSVDCRSEPTSESVKIRFRTFKTSANDKRSFYSITDSQFDCGWFQFCLLRCGAMTPPRGGQVYQPTEPPEHKATAKCW